MTVPAASSFMRTARSRAALRTRNGRLPRGRINKATQRRASYGRPRAATTAACGSESQAVAATTERRPGSGRGPAACIRLPQGRAQVLPVDPCAANAPREYTRGPASAAPFRRRRIRRDSRYRAAPVPRGLARRQRRKGAGAIHGVVCGAFLRRSQAWPQGDRLITHHPGAAGRDTSNMVSAASRAGGRTATRPTRTEVAARQRIKLRPPREGCRHAGSCGRSAISDACRAAEYRRISRHIPAASSCTRTEWSSAVHAMKGAAAATHVTKVTVGRGPSPAATHCGVH
jgi:hypothetical protein